MAEPAPTVVRRRAIHALLILLLPGFFTACNQESGDPSRQIESLKADLDEAKRRAGHLQNSLAAKDAELATLTTASETAKTHLAEKEQALTERDKQLRTTQAELEALKKRDAFVFADIAAGHQGGHTTIARARYEKFAVDYPNSPLVPAANQAIAQLSEAPREVQRQLNLIDPKRKDREFRKTFDEGYMTLQQLAPLLKKRSIAQVLALLGKPNQTFNSGTELGYADRAINPATGTRGMLVVSFDEGAVATLRVEYAGRKMTP